MKSKAILVLAMILAAFAPSVADAQKKTVTLMIFRHADREVQPEGDESDPDITENGQRRAVRLAFLLAKYKPQRILSTNYARTIQTVTPLARLNKLEIEFYEPSKLDELAKSLAASEGARRIAVVGHNSTSFKLVNLLINEEKYKLPADSEYGNLWIVKIKKGKVTEKRLIY